MVTSVLCSTPVQPTAQRHPHPEPQGVPVSLEQVQSKPCGTCCSPGSGSSTGYPSSCSRARSSSCCSIKWRYRTRATNRIKLVLLRLLLQQSGIDPMISCFFLVLLGFSRMASIGSIFRSHRRGTTPATPVTVASDEAPVGGNPCKARLYLQSSPVDHSVKMIIFCRDIQQRDM